MSEPDRPSIPAERYAARRAERRPIPWRTWLVEASRALDQRLRDGALPRDERRAARALLRAAFDVLHGSEDQTPSPALVRALDRAATPPGPRVPRPARIGPAPLWLALDRSLVERLGAIEALGGAIIARNERMLALVGDGRVGQALAEVVSGGGEGLELTLTQG